MSGTLQVLGKYWNYKAFRPLQDEIINAVLEKNDILAVLPTGGGKSICFQVPALMKDGVCIVITPLIALMKDQVENLKKREISASAIYSGMHHRQIDITLDNCIYGKTRFLYVSPERVQSELFRERVKRMNVSLIAVDEAHCISQWGHDFRPAYLGISDLRELFPDVNIIALTATATKPVKSEICQNLHLKDPQIFAGTFARGNLSYSVRKVEDKESRLVGILKKIPGSSIIYTKTRKESKEISEILKKEGISSGFYHAGLSPHQRAKIQESWMDGKIQVMAATNAFGMGIDKPDVRSVVHIGFPHNMESYYQEAGRAGRDEQKAYAVIIYQKKDIEESREVSRRSFPQIKYIQHVYQCLANYYKLAVGSEHGSGFDFVLNAFSKQYGLDHLEVYYALKRLEDEDLIQLSEGFFGNSSVFLQIKHDDLYKFQVANIHLDPTIKVLLRLYGGELFSQFTRISEYKMASMLKRREAQVKTDLHKMHKLGIITYSPRKDSPQIIFLTPRLDAAKLPIDKKSLNKRRNVELEKLEFMIRYVSDVSSCRTNLIQDYFGETIKSTCGVCDTCLSNSKLSNPTRKEKEIREGIIASLRGNPIKMQSLIALNDQYDPEAVLEIIRMMLDSGETQMDDQGFISV